MGMWGVRVFREAQVATDDVLEQPHTGVPDQGGDHVAQNVRNCKEPLRCLANVVEPGFVN